jgi:hypothetical protein
MDDRARLELGSKAQQAISEFVVTDKGDKNYFGGEFHRLDGTYVATTAYGMEGGRASQLDPKTVARLMKGEQVDPKEWRTGPTVAIEDAVRPWTQPARLETPGVRSY